MRTREPQIGSAGERKGKRAFLLKKRNCPVSYFGSINFQSHSPHGNGLYLHMNQMIFCPHYTWPVKRLTALSYTSTKKNLYGLYLHRTSLRLWIPFYNLSLHGTTDFFARPPKRCIMWRDFNSGMHLWIMQLPNQKIARGADGRDNTCIWFFSQMTPRGGKKCGRAYDNLTKEFSRPVCRCAPKPQSHMTWKYASWTLTTRKLFQSR